MNQKYISDRVRIEESIKDAIKAMGIHRMPTSIELRKHGFHWLDTLISRNGGLVYWADELKLPRKLVRKHLSDEEIQKSLVYMIERLQLTHMPSSNDINNFFGNTSLHNRICDLGYKHWSNKLSIPMKESETNTGKTGEELIINIIKSKGYTCERMTTGHPFDLLVNDNVKIDVKVGHAYDLRGSRCHTFGINKRHASCDIYIVAALPEEGFEIERLFIIPSNKLKVVTMSVGANSKYNQYIDRWDYIDQYHDFYKSII